TLPGVITPTQDYRRTGYRVPEKPLQGLDARVDTVYGIYRRRGSLLTELRREAEKVDAQAPKWKAMANQQLHEELIDFREHFRRGGKDVSELLVPALAALREASDRFLGLRPFVVQLMG